MQIRSAVWLLAFIAPVLPAQPPAAAPPLDIRQLMREVQQHQRQLDKVRESYTFSSLETTQDIDAAGQVKKAETTEYEDFFVNGHFIQRTVKKNGQPLDAGAQQKEAGRVTKLVEKAEKTPPGQPLENAGVGVSRLLEIMDVRNPRRETFRTAGDRLRLCRPQGRQDPRSGRRCLKKLEGVVWIDEADHQVAHLEVSFIDDFRIAGGLFAKIDKGSSFHFDQAPVKDGLWLPTGGEGTVQARLLLLKNVRQHFTERDYDYKRFTVETQESGNAAVK